MRSGVRGAWLPPPRFFLHFPPSSGPGPPAVVPMVSVLWQVGTSLGRLISVGLREQQVDLPNSVEDPGRTNLDENTNENHVLEVTSQKTVTFSSTTQVKTMETIQTEFVVEQTSVETNLQESLTNGRSVIDDKKTEKVDSCSVENIVCPVKPPRKIQERTGSQEEHVSGHRVNEDVCVKTEEVSKEVSERVESKVEVSERMESTVEVCERVERKVEVSESTEVREEAAVPTNSASSLSQDNSSDRVHENGRIPSLERLEEQSRELGSLYPNVVVKSEDAAEMIECKLIQQQHRKGSRQSVGSLGAGSRKGSVAFVPEKDIDTILADVKATLTAVEGTLFEKEAENLRVAVIGAGPAGLCAARHLLAEGIEAEVFEQCADIGGTWVYTEQAHSGTHVFPLHSSLYHDLWTNLPKETMQYPDFPYKEEGLSYLPSEKVLQYLVDYADHFNLHPIIKVRHQVKTVAPLGNYWSVAVEDLSRKVEIVSHFDAVMVCSGPNTIPVYPSIDGLAKFSGKQLHSRDYRRAETYAGKRVLIVGLGPSGLDITYQLQPTAKKVFLSHNRTRDVSNMTFPEGVSIKPKVKSLFDKTVTFEDDTEEEVDVIIYCTGYTYNFPFLTEECGLVVDQNVSPLYKHMINIEHPTMCIIGLPKICPHQYMVDYQVRAFLNILLGRSSLPPREDMLADQETDRSQRLAEGQRKKDFHRLGKDRTKAYMDDLTKLGKLDPVPPVMYKLFFEAFMRAIRDFRGFRKYNYKILDNENFVVEALENKITEDKGERTID